jgi:hypothetical protein
MENITKNFLISVNDLFYVIKKNGRNSILGWQWNEMSRKILSLYIAKDTGYTDRLIEEYRSIRITY